MLSWIKARPECKYLVCALLRLRNIDYTYCSFLFMAGHTRRGNVMRLSWTNLMFDDDLLNSVSVVGELKTEQTTIDWLQGQS